MRDHINEQPKSIAQLSQRLHQLQEAFQSKQNIIDEDISKSKAEIHQSFQTYQNDLLKAYESIIIAVEKTRNEAKEHCDKVDSELRTIKTDIEALAKETIFQPTRIEALMNQLNHIQEKIQNYGITKDSQMEIVLPKYLLKFQYNPPMVVATDTNRSTTTGSTSVPVNTGRRVHRQLRYRPYSRSPKH